jgi:SAM-dependent methyltransferase
MSFTQADILRSGYKLPTAPVDSWRSYDEADPVPGYFQFDWLSARHPDLYHQFALSTVGLIEKLHSIIDLTGCDIVDIGAGTGRSALEAAQKARKIWAVDLYESVVFFGKAQLQQTNTTNVQYVVGDREHLPWRANSVDVVINVWAELNPHEAYRILKPDGYLIQMGCAPDALCGELTAELAPDYPWIPKDIAPVEVYQPGYPDTHLTADNSVWNGIPVTGAVNIYQFTYAADYQDYVEAAAIAGRLYGPKAKRYFMTKRQSTFAWRLQIIIGQVKK